MSEELKVETAAPEAATETKVTPELTPTQEKALEQGWKPRDQFEGNEDEYIDAAEFVRRGELFGKIEHQGKELKAVRQALEALKQHHSKVAENEYNRALTSLKEARKQARYEGEFEKADAFDDQIEQVQIEKLRAAQAAQAPAVQEISQEFTDWTSKNGWYDKDKVMRAAADKIGTDYHRAGGKTTSEVLKLVEQEIREAFPHKFVNQNRDRANAVEGATRSGTSVQKAVQQLDDGEREVMRKFVRAGVMTEAQYLAELKKVKGQ